MKIKEGDIYIHIATREEAEVFSTPTPHLIVFKFMDGEKAYVAPEDLKSMYEKKV